VGRHFHAADATGDRQRTFNPSQVRLQLPPAAPFIFPLKVEPNKPAGTISNTARSTWWNGEHALQLPLLISEFFFPGQR